MSLFRYERIHPPLVGDSGREYKYRMLEDYEFDARPHGIRPLLNVNRPYVALDRNGLLTVKTYYAWDGASGPAIDTPTFMRGSAIHDALYQLIRCGFLSPRCRKKADRILRYLCREDGMGWIRSWWVYHFVRMWGGRFV